MGTHVSSTLPTPATSSVPAHCRASRTRSPSPKRSPAAPSATTDASSAGAHGSPYSVLQGRLLSPLKTPRGTPPGPEPPSVVRTPGKRTRGRRGLSDLLARGPDTVLKLPAVTGRPANLSSLLPTKKQAQRQTDIPTRVPSDTPAQKRPGFKFTTRVKQLSACRVTHSLRGKGQLWTTERHISTSCLGDRGPAKHTRADRKHPATSQETEALGAGSFLDSPRGS